MADEQNEQAEEKQPEAGDILLKFSGAEHVREVRRADLGVYPDSEEVLTWDASNDFINPTKLTEEEVQVLARSGGNWAVVTEESSTAPEEDESKIKLPTVAAPPQATDESSSDQADS